MLNQQLAEMKTAQESYKSLAAELDILRMEKNEIVQLKESEIKELKAKLSDIQSENHNSAGKNFIITINHDVRLDGPSWPTSLVPNPLCLDTLIKVYVDDQLSLKTVLTY